MPIDLNITSKVSYYTSKGPDFPGPLISLKTRNDLEQVTVEQIPEFTKILSITTTTNFLINRYKQSSTQTVYLSNLGTTPVSVHVSNMSYSIHKNEVVVYPKLSFNQDWSGPKTIIPPNETVELGIAYKGVKPGLYKNVIVVNSNNRNTSTYDLIYTEQEVVEVFNFDIYPAKYTNTSTLFNEVKDFKFNIYPFNGTTSSYTTTITGDPGFYISTATTSLVVVSFDNNRVENINGTYTTILSVSANGIENTASITQVINRTAVTSVYGSWLSAGAPNDSIVGMSYDIIDGVRTLTIGIGGGADGSIPYNKGGAVFLSLSNLGVSANQSVVPYTYWNMVYRIPIPSSTTEIPTSYKSADYLVKQSNIDYGFYFGDSQTQGSIFLVDDDGFGNLQVRMNRLRDLPDDEEISTTLRNLSRSLYYYSDVDIGGRYYQLGSLIGDFNDKTEIFAGFDRFGATITYLVDKPV